MPMAKQIIIHNCYSLPECVVQQFGGHAYGAFAELWDGITTLDVTLLVMFVWSGSNSKTVEKYSTLPLKF